MPSSRASTRTWPAISPAVRLRIDPHLAGQAEAAPHRAADLRRDAERLRRRVGDEDRLDAAGRRRAAAGTSSCRRSSVSRRTTSGVRDAELRRRACARRSRPRSVISREVGDAALVDPLEDLARVKARMSERLERLLELGELQFREIVTACRHGMMRLSRSEPSIVPCRQHAFRTHGRRAAGSARASCQSFRA